MSAGMCHEVEDSVAAVMAAVHCDLWVSMNGARKCVDLNTLVMQFQFVAGLSVLFVWRHKSKISCHPFTTNTSGSSLNWWWFLLLIHDLVALYNYRSIMVRCGSIAFGTGGKHGIHDSVTHIWCCCCAGSPVLLRFLPWVSEGSWHVS
jgi:hypothetical protein